MCQIPNPKSQIFFLSAKSQIKVPNPKSQIILDLGSIYNTKMYGDKLMILDFLETFCFTFSFQKINSSLSYFYEEIFPLILYFNIVIILK
jgi:hypothetical protein